MSQDCLSCFEEAIAVVAFDAAIALPLIGGSAKHETRGMAMKKSSTLKHPGDIFTVSLLSFPCYSFPLGGES
jgi:hypothetical protein